MHYSIEFIKNIPKKNFTYCDSFGSHQEPASDCDLDLVRSLDFDCLPLVNKGL